MLQARGDLAHMRGDHARMATEMQRAVANSRGTRDEKLAQRMGLANALGEGGDLPGEETQLRAVLRVAPGHIHARFALGNLLSNSGRGDDAISEFMMALQLPNDDPPLEEPMVDQLRSHAQSRPRRRAAEAPSDSARHRRKRDCAQRVQPCHVACQARAVGRC